MRASSCSTRAMRPIAAPTIRTRARAVEIRAGDGVWHRHRRGHADRRAQDDPGARARQCRRALGRARCSVAGLRRQRAGQGAPGAGLAHRGAQALRPRPRLHLPERRRPHHLRHSLRGRLHADRHHRPRLRRRSRPRWTRRAEEIDYLCAAASEYLAKPVLPADVVWTYSGVRPLYDDGASEAKAATRDYVLELDDAGRRAAAVDLWRQDHDLSPPRRGGAGAARALSAQRQGAAKAGPATAPLPGGDMDVSAVAALVAELVRDYPFLSAGACPPAGARLWHRAPRNCSATRSRSPISARHSAPPDGERGRLSDGERMGLHRRGRRVAPLQAGAAAVAGRNRGPRRLDGKPIAAAGERPLREAGGRP